MTTPPVQGGTESAAGRERRIGTLAGAATYAIWGVFPLYFHRLGSIGSLELACLRITSTCFVMGLVLVVGRDTAWIGAFLRDRRKVVRVALAGFMVASNWLIYVWAVATDRVVEAAIGYYINPLVTVALGVVLLRERLRANQKIALAFGAASVAVLTWSYGNVPMVALGLSLSFALYGYLKKTANLTALRALAVESAAVTPFAVVALVVMALGPGLDITHAAGTTQGLVSLLGVITAIPLVLFGVATRRIPLATIGLLQYISPSLQLLVGVVALHEEVGTARWVGVALVWIALVFLAMDAWRSSRAAAA